MGRREFIRLLGGVTAAWPLAARSEQPPRPVVGFLHSGVADTFESEANSFRAGLKETEYVENQNVGIEYRWGEQGRHTARARCRSCPPSRRRDHRWWPCCRTGRKHCYRDHPYRRRVRFRSCEARPR
jgi:hypothetical protein